MFNFIIFVLIIMFSTKEFYAKCDDWAQKYKDSNVILPRYSHHESWSSLFDKLFADPRMIKLEEKLSSELIMHSEKLQMYPKPDFVFRCFLTTALTDLKVVFLGQDPYFNSEECNGDKVPQAHGLSFSVMEGFSVPSSLSNIYKNLVKYGHLETEPTHGCLDFWAYQGCLMLNTALTVLDGQKKCHSSTWRWFTDEIIRYISKTKDHVVFVLWGNDAYEKIGLIDQDKHDVIISSHPSGLSADKPMKDYPSFNKNDHFGKINAYLKKHKQQPIFW
jgi:uracil-DNA glycosylase